MQERRSERILVGLSAASVGLAIGPLEVSAQSEQQAAFVANNGNLEGSVSAFAFDASGQPVLVEKLVIGAKADFDDEEPGTNASSIALSPNGRWLAVGHATASNTVEQLTVIEVASDASLSLVAEFTTPDSPLDLQWISDSLLAVTATAFGGENLVITYEFNQDPAAPALTVVDQAPAGSFLTALADHPDGELVYANDSLQNRIFALAVDPAGGLELVQTISTSPVFPLGIEIASDGSLLFAFGGISDGGDKVLAFEVGADGTLSPAAGSPFSSPGNSPKGGAVSPDTDLLFVAHGTDATIRSATIAPGGGLTFTQSSFDVGFQGSLGEVAVLGDLLLATDNSTAIDDLAGLYALTYLPDGSFAPNGPIVDSGGVAPTEIAVWAGGASCPADCNEDGALTIQDFVCFQALFVAGDEAADVNGDGTLSVLDFIGFQTLFQSGCP